VVGEQENAGKWLKSEGIHAGNRVYPDTQERHVVYTRSHLIPNPYPKPVISHTVGGFCFGTSIATPSPKAEAERASSRLKQVPE
jgi:hypothetical protein